MQVVIKNAAQLSAADLRRLGIYRRQVFVDTLGWQLAAGQDVEFDQFDNEHTVHVYAENDYGAIIGYGRLLRTDQPYLLSEVFPQLFNGQTPPAAKDIWELSRFAAIDFNNLSHNAPTQFSSSAAIDVLHAAIRYAQRVGGRQLISVSPLGIERWLRKAGLHARRAGPAMVIDGYALFACSLDLHVALPETAPALALSS